ncbi:MAG: hypothetical protein GWO02_19775 [Gammaproteobacteria bacterium]|nr:hypothetical protein [Gammaproteobacteria bacterium]
MDVVCLSAEDCRLLSARFAEHHNSHRRMAGALEEAGATEALMRLGALRRLEAHFEIDLGSLCHRFGRRDHPKTHPLERMVLGYVAAWTPRPDGTGELWVRLDRVRQVRELIDEGERVGEPGA